MSTFGAPLRLLLIEDNPADARLLQETLAESELARFEVRHVSGLQAGLEVLDREAVDLLLLDLSLPGSSGLATLMTVHARSPDTPVIVLTGFDDDELAVRAVREGAQDYLVKGRNDGPALVRAIQYAIERSRLMGVLRTSEQGERRRAQRAVAQLERLESYDELTGLPRRQLFLERLRAALLRTHSRGEMLGVLSLQLNGTREVQRSLGHTAADDLVAAVARRVVAAAPDRVLVGRVSTHQLVLVLDGLSDRTAATQLAESLVEGLGSPLEIGGRRLFADVEIGISLFPDDGQNPEELLRRAAQAPSLDRDSLSPGVHLYSSELGESRRRQLELEGDLRGALANDELLLHYQPVVDIASGAIRGVEGLVRWQHPTRGTLVPASFLGRLEPLGLLQKLDGWVLREGCRQAHYWRLGPHPELEISVNLSARAFRHRELISTLAETLQQSGLPPASLCVEITESLAMLDMDSSLRTVLALRELGVGVAIDDFGTGYSSMIHLQQYPVDRIKIDRSFVAGLPHDRVDRAIVTAILSLAGELDIEVVAEGVTLPEQVSFLAERGCTLAQGHLYHPALTAEAVGALLLGSPVEGGLPARLPADERFWE